MRSSPSSHSWSLLALAPPALLALFFLTIACVGASAQIDRAVLEGTATDPTGAAVVGAEVKILAVDTDLTQEQWTNSHGYYRFPGLAVGRYSVTTSGTGFRTTVVENVVLQVGQTRTLDVKLPVGAIAERMDVSASLAPAERSSAEASTVIAADQIENLPHNGWDWASFTLLAPFAQDDGGGDQRTIRFAGRARDDNNFQIDGVDAGGIQEQAQKSQTRLQISQDAIAEYRVNSALYDAEYGTQAGGQIDIETKSGTNNYHGSAFGFLRNSAFDARNFNDYDLNGNPAIPPFRMGQYGMTFGGPIIKDKTFFFAPRFSTSINFTGSAWDRVQETDLTRLRSTRPSVQRIPFCITPTTGTSIRASALPGLRTCFTERRSFDRVLESTTVPPRTTTSMRVWRATATRRTSI